MRSSHWSSFFRSCTGTSTTTGPTFDSFLHDRPRPLDGLAGFQNLWLTVPYLVFLTPAFVWAFWSMLRRARDGRFRYLLWTSLPAVAFPILVAPAGMARGHWWGPAYLELAVVVAALWNLPIAIMAACNVLVLAWVMVLALVVLPGIPPLSWLGYLYGWDRVAQQVEHEMAGVDAGTVVVTDDYEIGAALSYYGKRKFPVLLAGPRDPAGVWPTFEHARGANGVGVTYSAFPWTPCFRRSEEIAPAVVHPYPRVHVYRLHDLFAPCS